MAEYIEREKLSFHLASEMENCGEANSSHQPIAYGTILGLKTALSYVNTLSTADVVEVVRCKDCINSRLPDEYSCFCNYFEENVLLSGFCSYGEKRSDNNDPKREINP